MATAPDETGADPMAAELARAIEAAEQADIERGEALAALIEARNVSAAMHIAQAEWDILYAEQVEQARLLTEQVDGLQRRLDAITRSRSWRMVQALLSPYRLIRRRG